MKTIKNFYLLEIAVFLAGAVVMIFEMVGSRVVAPYLGTSIVVWTSLIGIILGSLSLGYFLGGIAADRSLNYKIFSFLFFLSSLFVAITAIFERQVLFFGFVHIKDIRLQSVFAMLLLFAPASLFLGMISPYAVRLKLKNLEQSGRTVGNLYALSTLGSIVGTFSAGFFLIPFFGTKTLLFIIAFILVVVSILLAGKELIVSRTFFSLLILTLIIINFKLYTKGVKAKSVDMDTLYNRLFVYDSVYKDNRPFRMLRWDSYGIQGGMYLDKKDDDKVNTVLKIIKDFRLVQFFRPQINKALLLGGGTYTLPGYFLTWSPEAEIDVVEIDPALLSIAKEKFKFKPNKRIHIYHEDARNYLNNNQKKYDVIFMDTFNAYLSYPFHLSTRETVEKIYSSLNDGGVVAANIIASLSGDGSEFLRAEMATYKSIFPFVELYAVEDADNKEMVQNILLIAKKDKKYPHTTKTSQEIQGILKQHVVEGVVLDKPVLTDDYAPVDYYALTMLKKIRSK